MDRHLQYYRTKEKMKRWCVCVGVCLFEVFFQKCGRIDQGRKKKKNTKSTNQPTSQPLQIKLSLKFLFKN